MKQNKISSELGFTMLELLFVLGIFVVFATLVLTNFTGIRSKRNLKIAQNELVSNIQKAKSYSLSARTVNGDPAKVYMIKFDINNPRSYWLQAIVSSAQGGISTDIAYDDGSSTLNKPSLEKINLPTGISIKSWDFEQPSGNQVPTPSCIQLAFALPFGRLYMDGNNDADGLCDVFATPSVIYGNLSLLGQRANSKLVIRLQRDDSPDDEKLITIYGISGRIEAQ